MRAGRSGARRACSSLVVSSENQRSTRFSHEELVGVKCSVKRGCAASQRLIVGVLCVELLSSTRCTARWSGTSRSMAWQELLELDRAVTRVQASDHLARGEVQRRVEARGAGAPIVVAAALGDARQQRQDRRGPIQRLDLGLLIDAQHDRALGRVQIEPDDVVDLVDELRVLGELEGLQRDAAATRTPARSAAPRSVSDRPRAPSNASTSASRLWACSPACGRSPPRPARR